MAISLEELVETVQKTYIGKSKPGETKEITEFLKGRLQTVLEARNLSYDVINAAVATPAPSLVDMVAKAEAIQKNKADQDFQKLVTAAGRVLRILPEKKGSDKVSKPLLKLPEEKDLYEAVQTAKGYIADEDPKSADYYEGVVGHLETLIVPVHAFFEKVNGDGQEREDPQQPFGSFTPSRGFVPHSG